MVLADFGQLPVHTRNQKLMKFCDQWSENKFQLINFWLFLKNSVPGPNMTIVFSFWVLFEKIHPRKVLLRRESGSNLFSPFLIWVDKYELVSFWKHSTEFQVLVSLLPFSRGKRPLFRRNSVWSKTVFLVDDGNGKEPSWWFSKLSLLFMAQGSSSLTTLEETSYYYPCGQ